MHKRGKADSALQRSRFADAEQFEHDPAEVVRRRGDAVTLGQLGDPFDSTPPRAAAAG